MEEYNGDAYCVKCKEKVNFKGEVKTSDSGRRMAMGKCPECGTKVNRILGEQDLAFSKPAVPLPPEKETYATIEIELRPFGQWQAIAKDYRRRYNDTEYFYAWKREKVLRKAQEWINSWEKIKYEREL